ncbi:hypothetical protein [Anaerospora hongkongensis]|uniref:hypothetical protein n=1 Tax=Anaerospora hongkongensis TaxID=244830 RepID=UPI0028A2AE78|nr:hypothetical protein [Anaerospora hongkongensis]
MLSKFIKFKNSLKGTLLESNKTINRVDDLTKRASVILCKRSTNIPGKVVDFNEFKPMIASSPIKGHANFGRAIPYISGEPIALRNNQIAGTIQQNLKEPVLITSAKEIDDGMQKLTRKEHVLDVVPAKYGRGIAGKFAEGVGEADDSRKIAGVEESRRPEFIYKNNPMNNPKAAKDIVENPDAVYGYSPNPKSTRIGKFANKIDWNDPNQVEIARQTRLAYHESNQQMLDNLYSQGYSTEGIAQKMVNERNANRLNSYLARGDMEGYEMARRSNLDTYQNADGPTPESMFKKYGSWEGVIEASVSSNPGMDACVGLYDRYHGGIKDDLGN